MKNKLNKMDAIFRIATTISIIATTISIILILINLINLGYQMNQTAKINFIQQSEIRILKSQLNTLQIKLEEINSK